MHNGNQQRFEFERWYEKQNIAYFSAEEVLFMGDSHSSSNHKAHNLNHIPPKKLWSNILPTLMIVDSLRSAMGASILIKSAYRSPEYNAAIGGGRRSQHKEFRALDIRAPLKRPPTLYKWLLAERRAGRWIGGLGLYRWGVHIDTRSYNATWRGVGI